MTKDLTPRGRKRDVAPVAEVGGARLRDGGPGVPGWDHRRVRAHQPAAVSGIAAPASRRAQSTSRGLGSAGTNTDDAASPSRHRGGECPTRDLPP